MPPAYKNQKSRILIFDVNETLLDIQALQPFFTDCFGDATVLKEWFAQTLLYSQSVTITDTYTDFSNIARLALEMTARRHAVQCSDPVMKGLLDAMLNLPAHPDVAGALRRLREHGFRLFTLTNSAPAVLQSQIKAAGLATLFEGLFSVDAVRKFKPHPAPYRYVADGLRVQAQELTMIAAHPWDLIGAKAVGYKVAFVERAHAAWFQLTPRPKISGATLDEIADLLIFETDGGL
jgi:2-haloacid dehalogenase